MSSFLDGDNRQTRNNRLAPVGSVGWVRDRIQAVRTGQDSRWPVSSPQCLSETLSPLLVYNIGNG